MNDTLSTPDPAAQIAEIRYIIEHREGFSCEASLLAIRRVVLPPPAEPINPPGGWPELHSSDEGRPYDPRD